ncbi:MAG: hypothetical protein A2Y25_11705 [Candidatus Melainabacteria bacterium GWF2_37_15]|nr:MAG: hypothetical protein A2Y25_11705 [Candidatus Melainabacteria bacterium GWF2_37_15]
MAYPNYSGRENKTIYPDKAVVSGNFPAHQPVAYEKPAIMKVNSLLVVCLLPVIILSMISYFGVVAKENKVKELHSATNKINFENIELQNKVDSLKSFYALDNKVQKMDFLKKPDQVIEVQSNINPPVILEKKEKFNVTPVPGF